MITTNLSATSVSLSLSRPRLSDSFPLHTHTLALVHTLPDDRHGHFPASLSSLVQPERVEQLGASREPPSHTQSLISQSSLVSRHLFLIHYYLSPYPPLRSTTLPVFSTHTHTETPDPERVFDDVFHQSVLQEGVSNSICLDVHASGQLTSGAPQRALLSDHRRQEHRGRATYATSRRRRCSPP